MKRFFALATVLLVSACGPPETAGGVDENELAAPFTGSGTWVKAGQCYWQLDQDAGTSAIGAWVLTDLDGNTGTALAFSDRNKFASVPTSDDAIPIVFAPDGEITRGVETQGWHPPLQGAYMISGELPQKHWQALADAQTIGLFIEGRKIVEVTAEGFPTPDELASCERRSSLRASPATPPAT